MNKAIASLAQFYSNIIIDPHSTRHLFDETSLDLKLVSSTLPSSNNYQSVCTLDKVKSALERAEKKPIVWKRTSFLKHPCLSQANPNRPTSITTTLHHHCKHPIPPPKYRRRNNPTLSRPPSTLQLWASETKRKRLLSGRDKP
ncbi:hypothetical protein JHK87_001357 [Glycine soja]|nr:hypothetical protein JHK87_001357 [Glycine soja]